MTHSPHPQSHDFGLYSNLLATCHRESGVQTLSKPTVRIAVILYTTSSAQCKFLLMHFCRPVTQILGFNNKFNVKPQASTEFPIQVEYIPKSFQIPTKTLEFQSLHNLQALCLPSPLPPDASLQPHSLPPCCSSKGLSMFPTQSACVCYFTLSESSFFEYLHSSASQLSQVFLLTQLAWQSWLQQEQKTFGKNTGKAAPRQKVFGNGIVIWCHLVRQFVNFCHTQSNFCYKQICAHNFP